MTIGSWTDLARGSRTSSTRGGGMRAALSRCPARWRRAGRAGADPTSTCPATANVSHEVAMIMPLSAFRNRTRCWTSPVTMSCTCNPSLYDVRVHRTITRNSNTYVICTLWPQARADYIHSVPTPYSSLIILFSYHSPSSSRLRSQIVHPLTIYITKIILLLLYYYA